MNPNRSFNGSFNGSMNGSARNQPPRPSSNASFEQSWNNQYPIYPQQGYNHNPNNQQGYSYYNPQNFDPYQGDQYYQQPNYSKSQGYHHNNSFSHGNMDHNQSYNYGQYEGMNNSFQSVNSHYNMLNSSVNSENLGLATTGRYGIGVNMKKKKKKGASQSSNSSVVQQPPKVKEPTVKEESSKEFYFPVKTEVISYAVCPFNAGHLMEPSKLLKHINNCKMNSQNAKHYKVCPYEPTHYFINSQIEAHILICDMRKHFVVTEQWQDNFDLNNSTVSSLQSFENEVIPQQVKKNPILIAQNMEKKRYEQFLIKP